MPRSNPPAFNIAPANGILASTVLVVHLIRQVLSPAADEGVLLYGGFLPELFILPGTAIVGLPPLAAWASPLTYSLLHLDWIHLFANIGFLLAFANPVERRIGAVRFLAFAALVSVAGALGVLILYWFQAQPVLVVGASGVVSGLFGAVARFHFRSPPSLVLGRPHPPGRRGLIVGALFIALNLLFGLSGLDIFGGVRAIAWEAHIAGFVAGYLAFPLFDPGRQPG